MFGAVHTKGLPPTSKAKHQKFAMTIREEKRTEPRSPTLRNYRGEIKLVGEPIYQFRVADVSRQGAGLLVNEGSNFLNLVEIGQTLEVHFISPQGSEPNGLFQAEVRHITETDSGRYRGVRLVGIRILGRLEGQ